MDVEEKERWQRAWNVLDRKCSAYHSLLRRAVEQLERRVPEPERDAGLAKLLDEAHRRLQEP